MSYIINLVKKLKNMPDSAKATVGFLVCNFLQKGIAFLTIPIFTRVMNTDEYGMFSVYQSWYSIIYIFATLELAAGVYNKGLIEFENEQKQYTSSMQTLSTVATLFIGIVYFVGKSFWNRIIGLPTVAMVLMLVDLLFVPATSFWSMKQRFDYKYKALVSVTLGISILSPIISLLLIREFTQKGLARIIGVAITNIAFGMFFYIFNQINGKSFINLKYWKYAISFNIPLIPHYLSTLILGQADKVMINNFFGETNVAIYSVAYTVSLVANIFTSSLNATFIPWTYKNCKLGKFEDIGNVSVWLLSLVGIISCTIVLISPEIMLVTAPKDYYEAIWIIPPVALGTFFIFAYTLFCNIEFAYNHNIFVTIASIIAAASNIILNYVFMKMFGYMAAGYTTLVCYVFLALGHYTCYRIVCKKHGIKKIYNEKIFLMIAFAVILVSILCMALYGTYLLRYMILIIFIVIVLKNRNRIFSQINLFKR